jgi:Raf kinase inhibitor-like YbhB/YbcL family protein
MLIIILGTLIAFGIVPSATSTTQAFKLASSAFSTGQKIPDKYTCDDLGLSPPLNWTGAPAGTKTYVLIVEDQNALNFTHWVIFNLPSNQTVLDEAVSPKGVLPKGAAQGKNDFGAVGYGGPCPPSGSHRYVFHLYALDTSLALSAGATKQAVRTAMKGHVLAEATLTGIFR